MLPGLTIAFSSTPGSPNFNMPCHGNNNQICGGPNALSMFQNLVYVAVSNAQSLAVQSGSNSATYKLSGCYSDCTGVRTLSTYFFYDSAGMTNTKCAAACCARGLNWSGTKYGAECYCGNTDPAAKKVTDGDCSMLCAGSKYEYCGNGNRLTVYKMG